MNQQAIIAAIITAIGTVSLLFVTKYVDAIFKTYPPDIKKHISFIKKFFKKSGYAILFAMRFIVPICYIGYLMYITKVVDKWFVLNVVTQSTILVLNIGFAFFYRLQRNFWKSEELQLQMATSYLKDNEIKNLEKQL